MGDTIRNNPSGIWPVAHFPFHHAVVEPQGRRIHISGQVAWDEERNIVAPGDAAAQTEFALNNIQKILGSFGGNLEDVVSFLLFYVNDDDYKAVCDARAKILPIEHGPATTAVKAAGLVDPDLVVEIAAVAVIPEARFINPEG